MVRETRLTSESHLTTPRLGLMIVSNERERIETTN